MNQLLKGVTKTTSPTKSQRSTVQHTTEHIGARQGTTSYSLFGAPVGDYDIHDDKSMLKLIEVIERKNDFYEVFEKHCKTDRKKMQIKEFEKLCSEWRMDEEDFLPL